MLETLIPAPLLLSFRLTLPFHLLQSSFRFNSSRTFDTSFLSFQYSHPVHVLLPFVSSRSCGFIVTSLFRLLLPSLSFNTPPRSLVTSFLSFQLLPSVCCQVVHFVTSVLTFHLVYKPPSLLLPLRFTSYASYSLFVTLILSSIRCNSFLSFLIYFSFLSFQLFPSVRPFL